MHVVPGPWLLLTLNAAVLAVAVGVTAVMYRSRAAEPAEAGVAWHAAAAELALEVREAAEPAATPADPDRVARRLLPLAGRIRRHVRVAPASAEAETYRRLYELGVACQRVAVEHRPVGVTSDGPFLEDRLEGLRDDADALAAAGGSAGEPGAGPAVEASG